MYPALCDEICRLSSIDIYIHIKRWWKWVIPSTAFSGQDSFCLFFHLWLSYIPPGLRCGLCFFLASCYLHSFAFDLFDLLHIWLFIWYHVRFLPSFFCILDISFYFLVSIIQSLSFFFALSVCFCQFSLAQGYPYISTVHFLIQDCWRGSFVIYSIWLCQYIILSLSISI